MAANGTPDDMPHAEVPPDRDVDRYSQHACAKPMAPKIILDCETNSLAPKIRIATLA
jgi:hypothetical protein